MDIATRFQTRARAPPFLERERNNAATDDSGNESESLVRRKFQRTTNTANAADDTFRKPSLPASASRAHGDQASSFSHHRRRSTLRDSIRIPSGPREYPSPGKRYSSTNPADANRTADNISRIGSGSIKSTAPAISDSTNTARPYLPHSTSEPFFSSTGEATHFTFTNPSAAGSRESPLTPAQQIDDDFGFIPSVNFDDLQNSIANYDGNGPLLSDLSINQGDRQASTRFMQGQSSRGATFDNARTALPGLEPREEQGMTRSQSLRRRLSEHPNPKDVAATASQPSHLSLRTRRQSTAPMGPPPSGPAPPPIGTGARAPRKSLGPGVIASMMEGRKTSQPLAEFTTKGGMARSDSIAKAARRTTMQPATSVGAELPRTSTLTATTQSRANKVKSLQPPPRERDPNTPHARSLSKSNTNRAHTPSSSGNKRQSTVSGRASGLGARTISPTDARRLKRLSMMQAPPVPSHPVKNNPPSPQEEIPAIKHELPRLAQPSPSLIPRKANNSTPTSARASPEGRFVSHGGGVSLSSKSSFQSLLASSASASRLPAPKPRNIHSSSAQYAEDEEMVPPVPAIPKAFESPRETDLQFFAGSSRSLQPENESLDHETPLPSRASKPSVDMSHEAQHKASTDLANAHHRINTIDNIERSINMTAPKASRPQVDPNGRKNNNLQPLRLPPLNLMPISQSAGRSSHLPRPSQDMDMRDDHVNTQTPEPRKVTKTPSTPLTASKATFYRRHEDDHAKQQGARSSSSHYALRELMQLDDSTTNFFDDTDAEYLAMGLPIPSSQSRNAITPFASGSLPKGSGEFVRQRGRPSLDFSRDFNWTHFDDMLAHNSKPQGPRPSRSGTKESFKSAETLSSLESPVVDHGQTDNKKESSGLRRKLSLNWRRSGSSKATHHADHKSSIHHEVTMPDADKAQKRASQMPPPRLPASATWSGDIPAIPATATSRPSVDFVRRKGDTESLPKPAAADTNIGAELNFVAPRNKSLHGEQPQQVGTGSRASSWGNIGSNIRPPTQRQPQNGMKVRQASTTSSILSLAKDKDDHAADDEMRRLSQKRRDVDTAARESEELQKRAIARSPMAPERVLHDRSCGLNIFERGEVMDYEKDGVYFTGTKNARKIIGALSPSPQSSGDPDSKAGNFGYDDERGDYNIVLGDHLAYRYEVVDVLGKGSFGQVVRCVDHKEGGVVAVKIIRNKKRFHQQALVEVGILGRLREWDPDGTHATLSITSSFYFRSHLCIVTPCLSINLYELIRAHNFVGFSLPVIRRFSRQLLSCLVLLQNKKIIHCDLKPENILLCEARKADVRVIDFGSSCREEEKVYTYIQSRFYRSPEVILGSSYGLGIDMWSLGCILAELWTGYPLFPGENEQEQLACIMEIFGPPDRHLVERCTRKKLFFDSVGKPRVTVSSKGRRRRPSSKTLSQALKSEDEAFLDFVSRCLRWDPERRMKPHEAVNHAFITNQPLHQRPGIPEEARRAARLRATAAVPAGTGGNPSPVKRNGTTSGVHPNSGNAFSQQLQQTPAKDKARPLPETPQTAVRTGIVANASNRNNLGSPVKQSGSMRRQSSVVTASAAATVGSKRASNGVPVSGLPAGVQQRQASGNNLAAMAAREANAANAARWRA